MFSSNKIQNGTTAIGKKAEEYEFGHIKVVYNKVKRKVKRRERKGCCCTRTTEVIL